MYTKPLGDLIRRHHLDVHFYADDTQIFTTFKPKESISREDALSRINGCIVEVKQWLTDNLLKLNGDKTEVVIFSSKHMSPRINDFAVVVGEEMIVPSSSARNLGVIFDHNLTMVQHVNSVCRSAYFQLKNISHIRRCLTTEATKSLGHGLVTSRIDYCNALLHGLPAVLTNKLQRVQNAGARLIAKTRRFEHITPVLMELHWLPVKCRLEYKVIVHTFKALHGGSPDYICDLIDQYRPS